eukprot:3379019-Pleurochrysis_carterae.AAC.3
MLKRCCCESLSAQPDTVSSRRQHRKPRRCAWGLLCAPCQADKPTVRARAREIAAAAGTVAKVPIHTGDFILF